MGPESKVKKKIKSLCTRYGAYYHMPVQNGMGKPTLDFIICLNGRFIGVEAKAPGKLATPRQLHTIGEMLEAGGYTMVVSNDDELVKLQLLFDMIVTQSIPKGESFFTHYYEPEADK